MLSIQTVRLEAVLKQLSALPPLVTSWEVENLKSQLAEAGRGERFLLQGGDCCESFRELPQRLDRQQAEDSVEDESGVDLCQSPKSHPGGSDRGSICQTAVRGLGDD